jgi:hypothetical protein
MIGLRNGWQSISHDCFEIKKDEDRDLICLGHEVLMLFRIRGYPWHDVRRRPCPGMIMFSKICPGRSNLSCGKSHRPNLAEDLLLFKGQRVEF